MISYKQIQLFVAVCVGTVIALLTLVAILDARPAEARNFHNTGPHRVDNLCIFNTHHRWENGRLYAWTSPTPWSFTAGGCQRDFVKVVYSVDGQVREVSDYGYPRSTSGNTTASVVLYWNSGKRLLRTKHCARAYNGFEPPGPSRCVYMN